MPVQGHSDGLRRDEVILVYERAAIVITHAEAVGIANILGIEAEVELPFGDVKMSGELEIDGIVIADPHAVAKQARCGAAIVMNNGERGLMWQIDSGIAENFAELPFRAGGQL